MYEDECGLMLTDTADVRLQELSGDLPGVATKQKGETRQKVLEMTQQKRPKTIVVESLDRVEDGIILSEFVSEVLSHMLKQSRYEVPDLILGSLVARLTDVILDKAIQWKAAGADVIIIKICDMLDRDELKRILNEYGIRVTKEMLKVGQQMRLAVSSSLRMGAGFSLELTSTAEDDSDHEIHESKVTVSDGQTSDIRLFPDEKQSIDAIYNIPSDVFSSQKTDLFRGCLDELPQTLKRVVRIYLCSNYCGK